MKEEAGWKNPSRVRMEGLIMAVLVEVRKALAPSFR